MTVLLLEPFFGGSHKQWAQHWQKYSRHDIHLLTLAGRHWKWRMQGGAVALAKAWLDSDLYPDLLVATDMLDLPTFLGLTRQRSATCPTLLYFHENQITYPWSPTDHDVKLGRDNTYGYINYRSAIAADAIAFNSTYHRQSFFEALPGFLRQFPDHREQQQLEALTQKSSTLPLALDLRTMHDVASPPPTGAGIILWNHRWEYDKNPELFFSWCYRLQEEGIPFRLIVLGEAYERQPSVFAEAKVRLQNHLLHFGYAQSRADYVRWLQLADILPVTSVQDFFGGSVVEAMFTHCFPILPNRLAYPEHITVPWRKHCLYESNEQGFTMLRQALLNLDHTRQQAAQMPNLVAHYDWQLRRARYDEWLDNNHHHLA